MSTCKNKFSSLNLVHKKLSPVVLRLGDGTEGSLTCGKKMYFSLELICLSVEELEQEGSYRPLLVKKRNRMLLSLFCDKEGRYHCTHSIADWPVSMVAQRSMYKIQA